MPSAPTSARHPAHCATGPPRYGNLCFRHPGCEHPGTPRQLPVPLVGTRPPPSGCGFRSRAGTQGEAGQWSRAQGARVQYRAVIPAPGSGTPHPRRAATVPEACRQASGQNSRGTYSGGPVATPARERVNGAMHTRPAVEVPLSICAGHRRGANLERMMVVQPGRMNVCNARGACQAPAGPRGPVLPLCIGPVSCPARTSQPASRAGVLPVRHSITS